jgi:hypothetical protein
MMFVDESGDPGYPKDGNWKTFGGSKIYTRLGLIIHGWRWKLWNEKIVALKQNRGLLWDSEIRGSDLKRGRKAFTGWEKARRELFSKDLATLIGRNANFTLIGIVIDKTKVDTTQKDQFVKPEIRSLELLLERFNLYLDRQQDKCGIVVLDPTKEDKDDNLRHFQSFLQSSSPHLIPLHIVEGTFFAKSHTSNMIQLSDFCCNLFFKEMAKSDSKPSSHEWKEIYNRFWRLNGRVAGISIKKWPEKAIIR